MMSSPIIASYLHSVSVLFFFSTAVCYVFGSPLSFLPSISAKYTEIVSEKDTIAFYFVEDNAKRLHLKRFQIFTIKLLAERFFISPVIVNFVFFIFIWKPTVFAVNHMIRHAYCHGSLRNTGNASIARG